MFWIHLPVCLSEAFQSDHATDPLELNNLAEKAAYQESVQQLSVELRERWGKDFLEQ